VYWLLTYRCTEGGGKCQHTSRSRKQTLTWYITCLMVNNIPWDCTNWTNLNRHYSSTGARGVVLLKLTTDGHKASRGLSATAELLVSYPTCVWRPC